MKFKRLDENSNQYRRLNKSLFGDPSGKIKTFAIISPQNPLGWKDSTEEEFKKRYALWTKDKSKYNKNALSNLKSEVLAGEIVSLGNETLKRGHFDYIPIKGSYGDREKTLLILNISFNDAKIIARNYGQESFFFGINKGNEPSSIGYYETNDSCQTYKLVEISNTIVDKSEAEDFFSKFGRKFSIELNAFGSNVTPVVNNGEFEESLDENLTFLSRLRHRIKSRE